MYLFFDTETTGLPRSWNAPVTDLNNWPRLVQLAYAAYDERGNQLTSVTHIIRPNGFSIPLASSKVHGITTEKALQEGEELLPILEEFYKWVEKCDYLVAHNISFDEKIMGAELLRNHINNIIDRQNKICTMKSTTNFCQIMGQYGRYKWPTLQELHTKLFGYGFENAHDAFVDVNATVKCFFELKRIGSI